MSRPQLLKTILLRHWILRIRIDQRQIDKYTFCAACAGVYGYLIFGVVAFVITRIFIMIIAVTVVVVVVVVLSGNIVMGAALVC